MILAYGWAKAAVTAGVLDEYEIAVQNFAASLLRSGLAVAVSVVERSRERAGFKQLLEHLAAYPIPGFAAGAPDKWPQQVREIADTIAYMQATRELVALAAWLKRACRALGAGATP